MCPRTPAHLAQSLIDAKANNFALGVKLVRGAYHSHEIAATKAKANSQSSLSISPDSHPPVWTKKDETDSCYNECAKVLIGAIKADMPSSSGWNWGRRAGTQTIGVLFGTHNWNSCDLILDELVSQGLASVVEGSGKDTVIRLEDAVTERLTIGQLFGK